MNSPTNLFPNNARLRTISAGLAPALLLSLCLGGCPFMPASGEVEDDGDTIAAASVIGYESDKADFSSKISTASDVDVYDLGVLSAGDRLLIDIQSTSGGLDPVAAVFDANEYLLAFSDDREPDGSDLDPLIDVIVHGGPGNFYLGVTSYYDSPLTGSYDVSVTLTRQVGILNPEPQIVYLNWAGGNIHVANVGTYTVYPFDAADLGPYAGKTENMKAAIQAVIADRYDGFNLILMNSDDDAQPAEPFSTVHFGGDSTSAFAIAEQIDPYNKDQSDDAIVFTDTFRNAFSITPSLAQMAVAIGNTAAHEIGHLLGLVHTKECSCLMDTTCGNDSLLAEQVFKTSELDDTVFPFGLQDALDLIEWAVGLSE